LDCTCANTEWAEMRRNNPVRMAPEKRKRENFIAIIFAG